tara:strand:- start:689 stop:1060 length:372 start_codon:yes stop_codon:yes gene_type:complete
MKLQAVRFLRPTKFSEEFIREGTLGKDEKVKCFYKGIRDMLIITDKRMITIDKKGLTGKKQTYLSVPIDKIASYSITTAGGIDLDSDLEIFAAGLGSVKASILRPTKNIDELVATLKTILFEK